MKTIYFYTILYILSRTSVFLRTGFVRKVWFESVKTCHVSHTSDQMSFLCAVFLCPLTEFYDQSII